jgi:diketogulonate reductase-like aldo/keto reductase
VNLSRIGQGTWEFEKAEREAIRALRRGVDLGLTHIDTAEMYGGGRVEEIVGDAIRGLRDRVFLASKVLPSNATYTGALQACERSLRRLGTDRLDLYLLHWRESTPLEESFRAFERLKRDGKILRWGVSNFDVADLDEAWRIARFECNQVFYHLKERAIEHAVIPWCEARGVRVVAYSPFGAGDFPAFEWSGATPRQAALGFLTRRPSVVAIPKAARVEHVEENARPAELTPEEVAKIDRLFPLGAPKPLPII